MNGLLQAATQTMPQLAAMGGLVWLVLVLFRRESTSEERHSAELTRVHARNSAEIERLEESRLKESAELKKDMATLREELRGVHVALDEERTKRRGIEDQLGRRGDAP